MSGDRERVPLGPQASSLLPIFQERCVGSQSSPMQAGRLRSRQPFAQKPLLTVSLRGPLTYFEISPSIAAKLVYPASNFRAPAHVAALASPVFSAKNTM